MGAIVASRADRGATRDRLVAMIPSLRAFALSLCGDPCRADDLVQETLVKAWDHLESFEEGTNLKAWLITILRNTFLSDYRKRRREVEDRNGDQDLAIHPEQYGKMDLQDFLAALAKLPPEQRVAIILVGAEQFSYEEVAKICGCSIGTIKSRVNRGRRRLADLLDIGSAEEFGPDMTSAAIIGHPTGSCRRD
jgi:RNA polymerase sigma-70 factor, ECF subfamily